MLLFLCQWFENTPVGVAMRGYAPLYFVVETAHTLSIVLVAGTIVLLDLRLLGWGLRHEPVSSVVSRFVPRTLWGFGVSVLTGGLLLSSEAVKLYSSPAFRIKVLLLLMAGLNALLFHVTVYRDAPSWDEGGTIPFRARLAGLLSLLFWIGIIAAGRAIAYGPGYDTE